MHYNLPHEKRHPGQRQDADSVMLEHHCKKTISLKKTFRVHNYSTCGTLKAIIYMKGRVILCLGTQDSDAGRTIQVPWLNYREREESPTVLV